MAFRASATATAIVAQTTTLTIPAGVQAGDVMLVCVAQYYAAGRSVSLSGGGGAWVTVRADQSAGGTNPVQTTVFRRNATAGDAGSTLTITSSVSGDRMSVILVAYSGRDGTLNAQGVSVSGADGTTITAPSVTTTVSGCDIVEFFGGFAAAAVTNTITGPAVQEAQASGAGNYTGLTASDQVNQASAGATGAQTATTGSNTTWVGTTIALAPGTITPPTYTFVIEGSSTSWAATDPHETRTAAFPTGFTSSWSTVDPNEARTQTFPTGFMASWATVDPSVPRGGAQYIVGPANGAGNVEFSAGPAAWIGGGLLTPAIPYPVVVVGQTTGQLWPK